KLDLEVAKLDLEVAKLDLEVAKPDLEVAKPDLKVAKPDLLQDNEVILAQTYFLSDSGHFDQGNKPSELAQIVFDLNRNVLALRKETRTQPR
ncbi:MAG: hypothetical protein C6Y22_09520, partial [Hapalosiphonaceae cyanobacterium JJU2]